jgi:sugar fermentation stimulation protein A
MSRSGCYILVIPLPNGFEGEVGSLGKVSLPSGIYGYVGSARSGLDLRLQRHIRREKIIHWHVDRLTVRAEGMWAMEFHSPVWEECQLAHEALERGAGPVLPGFGCSDCRCRTHLFLLSTDVMQSLQASCDAVFPPES